MSNGGDGPAPRARLTTISIRDFRNLARVDLEIPEEGAVLVGENGHGKTNFLEAVYYLELFRSSRGARDIDLVRFGADGFHLAARLCGTGAEEVAAGFQRHGRRKRVRIDGVEADRLSEAIGALPSVMWSPADVELVSGAPTGRRRYLDVMLALSSRAYLAALQEYRSALIRRNAALRHVARDGRAAAREERIAVWEPALARAGATLWRGRLEWVAQRTADFVAICREIGADGEAELRYAAALGDATDLEGHLRDSLEARRAADIRRGMSTVGPHRDDLVMMLGGHDLRSFGSGGQQRTAAIALRMLEVHTLREGRGSQPLFLLDDPFAELDDSRIERIVQLLGRRGFGQILLAVPRGADVPTGLPQLCRLSVREGSIREETAGG